MRTRGQIMQEWDAVRAKIANGCTNSGPSDWLEGVLDDVMLAEREACAKIADGVGAVFYSASAEGRVTKSIAGQIRNRQ